MSVSILDIFLLMIKITLTTMLQSQLESLSMESPSSVSGNKFQHYHQKYRNILQEIHGFGDLLMGEFQKIIQRYPNIIKEIGFTRPGPVCQQRKYYVVSLERGSFYLEYQKEWIHANNIKTSNKILQREEHLQNGTKGKCYCSYFPLDYDLSVEHPLLKNIQTELEDVHTLMSFLPLVLIGSFNLSCPVITADHITYNHRVDYDDKQNIDFRHTHEDYQNKQLIVYGCVVDDEIFKNLSSQVKKDLTSHLSFPLYDGNYQEYYYIGTVVSEVLLAFDNSLYVSKDEQKHLELTYSVPTPEMEKEVLQKIKELPLPLQSIISDQVPKFHLLKGTQVIESKVSL